MTTLQILDRATGEIIGAVDTSALFAAAGILDLTVTEMHDLAAFIDDLRELKALISEASNTTSDELIRRLDRNGKWTWREGNYEVKAPSPEAGTTVYDTSMLRDVLAQLVVADVISAQGAIAALEPIYPTAPVPYELLRRTLTVLDDLAGSDKIDAFLWDSVFGELEALLLAEPDVTYKQHAGGIKALLKIPAAKEPIEACRELVDSPRRTAKVRWIA